MNYQQNVESQIFNAKNTSKDQVINAFFLLPQVKGWPFSTKVHCQETNKVKVQAIACYKRKYISYNAEGHPITWSRM